MEREIAKLERRAERQLNDIGAVVKVRGLGGGSAPPASTLAEFGPPAVSGHRKIPAEPSLPTAGPKLFNSTKNHNVR